MGHKGHYGEYTGNAKWSKNHADTKVTKSNYKASERDDAAHIDYLKRDINYDNKHNHSDESMTADEKHISKLAGDMKYDKEHHDSPAKKAASAGRSGHPSHMQPGAKNAGKASGDEYWRVHQQTRHHQSAPTKMNGSPVKHDSPSGRSHIHTKYHTSYEGDATFPEDKKKGKKVVSGTHTSDSNKPPIIDKETKERLPKNKN